MIAPIAKRIPHPHVLHNDIRPDDYYWLRDRTDPEVVQYLEDENRYWEDTMRPLEPLVNQIYQDMIDRIPPSEEEVPVQDGPYFYFSRTAVGKQYPTYLRSIASHRSELDGAREEEILDLNKLTGDSQFLSVTVQRVSPGHDKLAYLENRDGSDRYVLLVKNLTTGQWYSERIHDVFLHGSLEWDAQGEYLYYVTVDASQRPSQLWRHKLGDSGPDTMLFEETDATFSLSIEKSRSGQYLLLKSHSTMSDEVWYVSANEPLANFQCFDRRRRGIKYDVEHWGSDFLILTNEDADNFQLLRCAIGNLSERSQVFPYDPTRYLEGVYPFQSALLLSGRQNGLTQLWIYRDHTLSSLSWEEPLYTVSPGHNRSYDTPEALIYYESLLTPRTTLQLDLTTGVVMPLKIDPVAGDYEPTLYHQERLWARAQDGTLIPLSVSYRQGTLDLGPAPLILYGYGSYGVSMDPTFDAKKIPLMDRGIVLVTAHVRGGAEMGRHWYENGKLLHKRNTFTDFIDAAKDLINRGYTTPGQLAARGRSAGGLLMGAILNLAPDLFQVVVPGVPFVDVLTTMLDATIPLTSLEWDEWGNPIDAQYYAYMRSYSPYDNIEAKAYPHILMFTGLNDPRVGYWEPAKMAARLRATKTDSHTLLLKTLMGAGHGGPSGRYNRVRDLAEEFAFILDKIGVHA